MSTAKTTQTEKTTQPRPATRDHLTSRKKPMTKFVEILLDPDALDIYERAQERLGEATADTRAAIQRDVDDARAAVIEATVTMKFQSLGRKRYEALIAEHPATEKQNEQALKETNTEAGYNLDTFPPALIQASCIEPELSLEDVQAIYDSWNSAELMTLFFAALEVNTQRRTADFLSGSSPILG
jgi:hypothetical protein